MLVILLEELGRPAYLQAFSMMGSSTHHMFCRLEPVPVTADASSIWYVSECVTGHAFDQETGWHVHGDYRVRAERPDSNSVSVTDRRIGVTSKGTRLPVDEYVLRLGPDGLPLELRRQGTMAAYPTLLEAHLTLVVAGRYRSENIADDGLVGLLIRNVAPVLRAMESVVADGSVSDPTT